MAVLSYAQSPNPVLPESFYVAGQTYTVSGIGGADVAAFNVSAIAPGEIIITEPDLSTLDSINSNQDLTLRWQGNNGVGEIEVTLVAEAAEDSYNIICRFVDDGEAVISSSLLVQLRDVAALNPGIDLSLPPELENIPGIDLSEFYEKLSELSEFMKMRVAFVFSRIRYEFLNNNDGDYSAFFIIWVSGANPKIH